MTKDLKNKPLVEVILELRWVLPKTTGPGLQSDPHYRLLLGRFSERIQKEYPFYEPLPTAEIPDGMVEHTVQHRFRVADNNWPLVQIGPGIITVNDTKGYTWTGFQKRCETVVSHLFEAYPDRSKLKVQNLTLRYIDAVAFDFNKNDIFNFLEDKLKTKISLPNNLFEGTNIKCNPSNFSWQASFFHEKPGGLITLRFATGKHGQEPSIIWETLIQSTEGHIPKLPDKFSSWLDDAHSITDDWFFKLIEGELERRFSGE